MRVSIVDEISGFLQETVVAISEVSRNLAHPLAIGLMKDPADIDSSRLEKDLLDRVAPDLMPVVEKRSSDPYVAPARILASHLQDQSLDIHRGLRPTRPSALAPIILSRDQLSVPSEQSVWGHEGLDFGEPSSADFLSLQAETPALLIGEADSLLAQLLA